MTAHIAADGFREDTLITVDLGTLLEAASNGGLEGFLDLLDELTRETRAATGGDYVDENGAVWELEPLTETDYAVAGTVAGTDDDDLLLLRVTGWRQALIPDELIPEGGATS